MCHTEICISAKNCVKASVFTISEAEAEAEANNWKAFYLQRPALHLHKSVRRDCEAAKRGSTTFVIVAKSLHPQSSPLPPGCGEEISPAPIRSPPTRTIRVVVPPPSGKPASGEAS